MEAWATAERMNAANEARREIGAAAIAEGHTLDDQAETVLLNLIRGSGLEGVSGIWPGSREVAIVEPCSRSSAWRSRRSVGRCTSVRGWTRRTGTGRSFATRSASR